MSLAEARAYLRAMPFLPVTPAFFAALPDAVVEELVFDAAASRLQLTLRLVSFTNDRFVHRREQAVLPGLRHEADVERLHPRRNAALRKSGRIELGYGLDDFCLLPPEALKRPQDLPLPVSF